MSQENSDAQKARARKLRKQIEGICGADPEATDEDQTPDDTEEAPNETSCDAPSDRRVSPRDFIHRKMRELDGGGDESVSGS